MSKNKFRFEVILDSTGFSFKGPRGSKLTPRKNKDGTYHLIALSDSYEIATGKGRKKPVKKTTSKKKK